MYECQTGLSIRTLIARPDPLSFDPYSSYAEATSVSTARPKELEETRLANELLELGKRITDDQRRQAVEHVHCGRSSAF